MEGDAFKKIFYLNSISETYCPADTAFGHLYSKPSQDMLNITMDKRECDFKVFSN